MTIEEVGKKVKNMGNGKGLWIIGGGFVVLFLISLASQSSSKDAELEENVKLTGAYASYPDVATNADVVISTLQDSLDFQTEELSELMQGNFDATNDYIKEGIETNTAIAQITHADIMQGIDDLSAQSKEQTSQIMNHVSNESSSIRGSIGSAQSSILSQMDKQYSSINQSITHLGKQVEDTGNALKENAEKVANVAVNKAIANTQSANKTLAEQVLKQTSSVMQRLVEQSKNKQQTGSPAASDTITVSSGVDVFAPSVYYE